MPDVRLHFQISGLGFYLDLISGPQDLHKLLYANAIYKQWESN